MNEITERQELVLNFIKQFLSEHGFPPTVMEIADGLGFKSGNGAHEHLRRLVTKGYITMQRGACRSIKILEQDAEPDEPSSKASHPSILAAVKACDAIREGDPKTFHSAFIKPLADGSAKILEDRVPGSAKFLFLHADFVERHLTSLVTWVEGAEGASGYVSTLLRKLGLHFQGKEVLTLPERSIGGSPTTFSEPVQLLTYFESVVDLHNGDPSSYMSIWQTKNLPLAGALGAALR